MSGFSASWLALREPVDHAARDAALLRAVAARLAGLECPRIMDLGAGAGSNLRATAPYLGPRQHWTLVDHDAALIAAALDSTAAWADSVEAREEHALTVRKDGRQITLRGQICDLAAQPAPWRDERPDLVTAAALFDLVSSSWLDRFAAELSAARLPLYTTLIYDGMAAWDPPRLKDPAMVSAFNAHQRSDKGFGPACGPDAAARLEGALRQVGYRVERGASPWRLPAGHPLMPALVEGWAVAVRETGRVDADEVARWAEERRGAAGTIGHWDLLALPD